MEWSGVPGPAITSEGYTILGTGSLHLAGRTGLSLLSSFRQDAGIQCQGGRVRHEGGRCARPRDRADPGDLRLVDAKHRGERAGRAGAGAQPGAGAAGGSAALRWRGGMGSMRRRYMGRCWGRGSRPSAIGRSSGCWNRCVGRVRGEGTRFMFGMLGGWRSGCGRHRGFGWGLAGRFEAGGARWGVRIGP